MMQGETWGGRRGGYLRKKELRFPSRETAHTEKKEVETGYKRRRERRNEGKEEGGISDGGGGGRDRAVFFISQTTILMKIRRGSIVLCY